ncbi:hypothetical protein F4781DRAFT_419063 [Annulohypoxylon bovei var. microspora]|nr:hypothetical protein F4781DRAFT_419063 [Annulohypoxylon bovei var. microspora]
MNPLLRLAMSNFDFANEKVVNTAGYLALKAFYCDRGLQNSDLTFMTLSEHDLMQKTLWKRSPFLLYNPKTLGHVGREEWSWNVTEDLSKIAQTSLIRFTTGDLGETVSATFRSWVNENFEYIRSANHPAVLRVHYTVNQSEPKRFKDLRHIVVDMRSLVQRPDDQTWGLSEKGARLTNYGLIAEVRLSSTSSSSHANAKSQDTVRVYTLDGQVIPIPHSFPATHINDPLGQPGNSYILYYGMCPNTSPISDAVTDTPLMKTMATRDAIDKVIRSGYSAS